MYHNTQAGPFILKTLPDNKLKVKAYQKENYHRGGSRMVSYGGVETKIGKKGANFARFWPILEGAVPPCPSSGSTTVPFKGFGRY